MNVRRRRSGFKMSCVRSGGGVEEAEVELREAVRCQVRCAWGKFNEIMPILTMGRDLLKGEGEDLQSLCAKCDDVWQ